MTGIVKTRQIVPATEVALTEQASVYNEAFAGYLGGFHAMDVAMLARVQCAQGVDLCYSRYLQAEERLVAFGWINRTGQISRLSGMGVVPSARRSGAAKQLLLQLLDEAKIRGDELMTLEVFEQNEPALALYRRNGFEEICRLFGWRRSPEIPPPKDVRDELEEISVLTASRLSTATDYPEIPWQISRYAIVRLPGAKAFRVEGACVVTGDPGVSPLQIRGLFPASCDESDFGALRIAVSQLLKRFSQMEFFAPAIFPEQFGKEIFEPLGFTREQLNQFLMRKEL